MDEPALLAECADWIAAQLEEENILVDVGLVELVLRLHRDSTVSSSRAEAVATLQARLESAGVRGMPDSVDARLLTAILEWEDEFLALAGRTRLP